MNGQLACPPVCALNARGDTGQPTNPHTMGDLSTLMLQIFIIPHKKSNKSIENVNHYIGLVFAFEDLYTEYAHFASRLFFVIQKYIAPVYNFSIFLNHTIHVCYHT